MPAGRRPMGIEQVELLPGSAAAKLRLEVMLANLAGELSVEQACAALGLHKSRFFELRKRWLQESVESLEPEPAGRPAGSVPETSGMALNQAGEPETGADAENRHPRIASNASGRVGPAPDTSGNGVAGSLGRIAELEDQLAQTRWELRTSRLREELATLGLSRPKAARPAQKKTKRPDGQSNGERGGAP
jgi:Helix-turn-helix domain